MLRIIVNCGPAEEYIGRCIASIRDQSFTDWQAYVTVDPCGDRTYCQSLLAREGDPRIHIRQNRKRRYATINLIRAIRGSRAGREDVIVTLDGDDWFSTRDALNIIRNTYEEFDCWMTYGSWVPDRPVIEGRWPAYPEDLTNFRNHEWLGTAVRTWKRWLWDLIADGDLRDAAGNYFRVSEDQAVMLPMLEMSGTRRAKHIKDVLMVYTRSSPHACAYTRRDEMLANTAYIRMRPPYARLAEKPDSVSLARAIRRSRETALTQRRHTQALAARSSP